MPTKKKTKSKVNQAGNYTKPTMRKNLFNKIKAGSKGGKAGQWSARKAQMLAKQYKAKGGAINRNGSAKSQKSLKKWGKQNGVPQTENLAKVKEYLPDAAWKSLSKSEKAKTKR